MADSIGDRAKRARERAKLTQEAAAREAGVSSMTVSRLERAQHSPETGTIRSLAKVYKVSAKWLLDGDEGAEGAGKAPAHRVFEEYAARHGITVAQAEEQAAKLLVAIEGAGGVLPDSTPHPKAKKRRGTSGG